MSDGFNRDFKKLEGRLRATINALRISKRLSTLKHFYDHKYGDEN
jgi:hypothetical protein